MAKNAGESRIPLPRTVRPSLLPKIRSLGPPKISSAGHRRSPVYCSPSAIPGAPQFNNKQQQQQQHFGFGKRESANLVVDSSNKQSKSRRSTPDTEKDCLLDSDYSISAIWNCTTDNKETEHLMRLNEEKLNLLRSQEDLASFGGIKKKPLQLQQSHEDVSDGGGNPCNINAGDFAIESPVATAPHYLMLTKQNSFEHDESSLGILTPDQMTDFTVALESSRTPSCENLSGHANPGKFLLGKSNAVVAAAARHLDIAACVPSIEALIPQNDRSPSLEELPLDPVVIIHEDVDLLEETLCSGEEIPTILQQPADLASEQSSKTSTTTTTTAIDSTETSEHTSDQQTRCSTGVVGGAHVLPTSFITSVTSITSLEAGYQGDGENSRPASRGPEPLSITPASNLLVSAACRQDPMTDSDFFTESDADAHEEIVRGDRRAQVIDGTLFCAPNERRCPSFEPGEEMDSSGIYSDLDKRQDSVGIDGDGYAEGYGDGDHTTDTGDTEISMRSQPSPQDKTPMPALVTKNMLTPQDLNDTLDLNSTASTAELTVIKCQKNEQNAVTKSKSNISNKENSAPLKKYKMPKRNVISKIKTMIESNQNLAKEETESEPRRPQRQQRKNGRWDAVMNKIEAGKQRGRSLKKEVKSRVLQGLGTSTSSTASTSSTRRPAGDANNNAKDKRRARGRPETNSPNQETARSSVRSSASDLSSAHSKEALKRPTRKNCMDAHQPNNNQLNSNLNKSNLSTVRKAPSIKSVQSNVNSKQKNATTNKVADRNTANTANNNNNNRPTTNNSASTSPLPANNKEHSNGPTTILNNNHNHHHHHHHLNNHNHVHQNSAPTSRVATPTVELNSQKLLLVDTREQEIQTDLQLIVQDKTEKDLLDGKQEDWCKKAEDTVQALAITVQYFTHQLEDVSEGRIRKDLDKMKTEWLSARSELEELRLRKASIEDALSQEREEHLQAIESLREDLERELAERSSLEQSYIEERHRVETLQDSLQEKEREQRLALERLNSEHELELAHARSVAAQTQEQGALLAEVESLRTVLEIRSQENSQLRSEVDILRRELDDKEALKLRCESLEARCEDLKAQLQSKESIERQLAQDKEVLMGSIHQMSKQNKRLSQRNEELLWRLRQKSEVVSVLTNQLTPQSQRLSKSLGPEHTDHAANDSNCSQKSQEQQSCSMVKYMVEKGDSVSWTLDITESMDSTMSSSAASCTKSPSPSARRFSNSSHHESNGGSNGTFVSRQSSLRLSMPRRTTMTAGRARSNSVSVAESSANASTNDEPVWSPSYQSTPLQRRRNVTSESPQSWSLTNTVTETTCTSNVEAGINVVSNSSNTKVVALEVSTTDEDEEEDEEEEAVGQRPQEAGGEAMISEETSASSSSEDDESSVSSSDIP